MELSPNATTMEEDLYNVITHTFLPKKLPAIPKGREVDTAESNTPPSTEVLHLDLLHLVSEAVEQFDTYCRKTLDKEIFSTIELFKKWSYLQSNYKTTDAIHQIITTLNFGEMAAIYVEAQNAGLIFAIDSVLNVKEDEKNFVTVAGFQASCTSSHVMSADSDLLVDYPMSCVKIPQTELLDSAYLSDEFLTFAITEQVDLAFSKGRKAGRDHNEIRDVVDPLLIMDFVIPSLMGENSSTDQNFPRIRKKVRDDVILGNKETLPFRRSGCWMTIKVALQISLKRELEHDDLNAHIAYKCIILQVLLDVLKTFHDKVPEGEWDLKMQMIAKISRRFEKIKILLRGQEEEDSKLSEWILMEFAKDVAHITLKVRKQLDLEWGQMSTTPRHPKFQLLVKNVDDDTKQTNLTKLLATIEQRKQIHDQNAASRNLPSPLPSCPARVDFRSFPNLSNLFQDQGHVTDFELCQVENWIQYSLDDHASSENCEEIQNFCIYYSKKAIFYYSEDPLAYSKFILCLLKCIQVLDTIIVEEHPLLREHKSGVDVSCVSQLLLRTKSDMQWAKELEEYFTQRDQHGKYPSLISNNQSTIESFSVRYAQRRPEMQALRVQILSDIEAQVVKKIAEVKKVKEECEDLRRRIAAETCKYEEEYNSYYERNEIKHVTPCTKCSLEKSLGHRLKSVCRYERPLHEHDTTKQNAVVFELLLPKNIGLLRDMLYCFQTDILRQESALKSDISFAKHWISYEGLGKYQKNVIHTTNIKLGSTTKPSLKTHYTRGNPSVDLPESNFILPNGLNMLYQGTSAISNSANIQSKCILKINGKEELYKGMQWTINSTNHTPNDVLARQIECPKLLPLAEFVQFGTLRAGNRIQYRNILVALTNSKLSLRSEAVFVLLAQTMWEAGSDNQEHNWIREAHVDPCDPNFAAELLELVSQLVTSNEKRWNDPFVLCNLVIIASRVFELTDGNEHQLRKTGRKILQKIRNFAVNWIKTIEGLAAKATDAAEEEQIDLKQKLILASFAVTLSFSVSPSIISEAMVNSDDLFMWLTAIATIQNELLWNLQGRIQALKLTEVHRILLRLTISTALMLEPRINELITDNLLNQFTKQRWQSADLQKEGWIWEKCPAPKQQIYRCMTANNGNNTVYVDVILGKFLVDGCPIGKLPEQITRHKDFLRVFQNAEFSVQPNKQGLAVVFTSTVPYHGCNYGFQLVEGILIVHEINNESQNLLELVPHLCLDSKLPTAFEVNYSHWWSPKENRIYFREKDFNSDHFSKIIFFILDLNTLVLTKFGGQKSLLEMRSSTVKNLTEILKRVEEIENIHLWRTDSYGFECDEEPLVVVELTKLELKFNVSMNGVLKSREFPGMEIDLNQDIETLIGLQNKVVLMASTGRQDKNPKVIIPKGSIIIKTNEIDKCPHQVVKIAPTSNFKFFVYELDFRLKQLVAGRNQSAWLQLAALHGATSSPLPDPFTGLTGTEMAFQILQSARVWSFKKFDDDSLKILRTVKAFAPIRSFFPRKMKVQQTIKWPKGLSSTSAHEGYVFLVDKLIEDSERLTSRNDEKSRNEEKTRNDEEDKYLIARHYWRHNTYLNDLTKLSNDFFSISSPSPNFYFRSSLLTDYENKIESIRRFAELCHGWKCEYHPWMKRQTSDMLMSNSSLGGIGNSIVERFTLNSWFTEKSGLDYVRDNWIDLYRFAVKVGHSKAKSLRPQWQLLLSAMIFRGVDINIILTLQVVAVNSKKFKANCPPQISSYSCPTARYSEDEVRNTIRACLRSFGGEWYPTYREKVEAMTKFNEVSEENVEEACLLACEAWEEENGYLDHVSIAYNYDNLDSFDVQVKLNALFTQWHENLQLKDFLEELEDIFEGLLTETNLELSKPSIAPLNAVKMSQIQIIPKDHPRKDLLSAIMSSKCPKNAEAKHIFENTSEDCEAKHFFEIQDFKTELRRLKCKSEKLWKDMAYLLTPECKHSMKAAGLHPRLVPLTLLPLILLPNKNDAPELENIRDRVGAICVLWTLEQKMMRCVNYLNAGPSMEVAFTREKETEGKRSWNPKCYPGWLILEIELNMMIRPIQLQVAREMMTPSSGGNSVMQLNMGEGKTALIVPMLAVELANGNQICRVTVIRSIFETNLNSLRHTLGGLLNRRVYSIPCRRDIRFTIDSTKCILTSYEECLAKRGLIVTLPEHRLSFQLKGYEVCRKKKMELAGPLLEIQNWINTHVRDILDESDEILHVKYQLIYTNGFQQQLDGGELRWRLCQNILKCLPKALQKLSLKLENNGDSEIEFDDMSVAENPAIFPHCRLLQTSIYEQLINILAEDFLNGEMIGFATLKIQERQLVKKFLIDNKVSSDEIERVRVMFSDSTRNWEILLILSGYLRFGVLEAALTKRWRVNYGVNVKGPRDMAVPFRAKDVASERTEFGHPDVAIILTQLSYYYSGLNDKQMNQCFLLLKKTDQLNPAQEYAAWLKDIPLCKIDASVRRYDGINLADYTQRKTHLFPMLYKVKAVIDFWLSNFVFRKESKQFPGKMTCTAWDLCSENKRLLTTGFSGTNDTQRLLPLPIKQNDLEILQYTNKRLEDVLLHPVNDSYVALDTGISSRKILENLKNSGIKVLLDCGALMLELNNNELAKAWLEIDKSLEAVVFFNRKNILTVKTRKGKDCEFELSPFREMMEKCAIYLDDEHTRGTDLKFPRGSKACVTLGSGLTRDKMVQACMRMRMLESRNHSVTFWVSSEVNTKIIDMNGCERECGSKDVLKWVKANSEKFEEDGLIHWSQAAVNYSLKRGAEKIFKDDGGINFAKLGEQCTENEVLTLKEMYGHSRQIQLFTQIVPRWFLFTKISLFSLHIFNDISFRKTEENVLNRLNELIPKKEFYSQLLDEEQEKELEFERELEVERELPPRAKPLEHTSTMYEALMIGEIIPAGDEGIKSLPHAFFGSNVWPDVQVNCWGSNGFATRDFINTVIPDKKFSNRSMFLRPPTWVVKMSAKDQLLLISPYEANALIGRFRSNEFKCSLHLYVPRYLPDQDILLTKPRLQLPSPTLVGRLSYDLLNWHKMLPPLSLCAGNLFFGSDEECDAFANFLALIPKPWANQKFQKAFEQGWICKSNGFVDPSNRGRVSENIPKGVFEVNPQKLVTEIIRIRHEGVFSEDSHLFKMAIEGKKDKMNN